MAGWYKTLAERGIDLHGITNLSGTTPPSVFVGSYNYPEVYVGPMVSLVHDDTDHSDSPEMWSGMTLDEIVRLRLNMVRGIRQMRADSPEGRYVESLQEVTMSSRPSDSDLTFDGPIRGAAINGRGNDGTCAPFGPVGSILSARFADTAGAIRPIERVFYDSDLGASDAVMSLYGAGTEISKIQRCLSMGMMGRRRRLIPTKWSITAADSIISSRLLDDVLEYGMVDSCRAFWHEHLGNVFAVVLFPHRWIYELVEAWHTASGVGAGAYLHSTRTMFGSDAEDARRRREPAETAGAYHAAKLGVLEYLHGRGIQAGVLVLREIRPEYAVPVGVWQVREGVRAAMRKSPVILDGIGDAVEWAASVTGVLETEWIAHSKMMKRNLLGQTSIDDF